MTKSFSRKKQPIWKVGDRLVAQNKKGTIDNAKYTSIKPYLIRWDDGSTAIYSKKDIEKFGYQVRSRVQTRVQECLTDAGTQLSLTLDMESGSPETPKRSESTTIFSRENWEVGDCISIRGRWGKIIKNNYSKQWPYEVAWDIGGKSVHSTSEFDQCSSSEPVDSLRELEGSPKQLNLLEDSTGESQLSVTLTQSQSLSQTSNTKSMVQISETFIQDLANTIYSLVDSRALEQATPDLEQDSSTHNQGQCSESSSDVLEKPNPNLSFWSSLQDLSIEDLERGLEDCEWEDIKALIQTSQQLINLERSLRGKESLSFPTLLAGHGGRHRDVGLTECEKWWKQHLIQNGSQLSSEAIAGLHGFPANWFRSISPRSVAPRDTQADLPVESWEVKQLPYLKPELPLNGSNGYGQNFSREYQIQVNSLEKSECPRCSSEKKQAAGGRFCDCGWSEANEHYRVGDRIEIRLKDHTRTGTITKLRHWTFDADFDEESDTYVIGSNLRKIEESPGAVHSLEKPESQTSKQVGSLYQYTKNRADKLGTIHTYPKVEGERKREEDAHWYWGFSYVEKERAKWRDKSAAVSKKKLAAVRLAIWDKKPYTYVLQEILGKD